MNIQEHLIERGCDISRYPHYLDEDNGLAIFYLYNFSGQLVGYQQYRPNAPKTFPSSVKKKMKEEARYFTYVSKVDGYSKHAMFGIETLDERPYFFIVEGIFDAMKIHNAGQPCVATLCNNPSYFENFFVISGKKIYSVADNDGAGNKMLKFADGNVIIPSQYKDVGEMPQKEVNEMLERFFK